MESVIALIKMGIFFIGTIPAFLLSFIIETKIIAILLSLFLLVFVIINFNLKKLLCYIGIIGTSALSNYYSLSNPGTDDSLSELNEVVSSMFYASLYATIVGILLIVFVLLVIFSFIKKKNSNVLKDNKI